MWKDTGVTLHHVTASCSLPLTFCFSFFLTIPSPFLSLYLHISPLPSVLYVSLSTRQPRGGSLKKMLGSERGVVEEWLSEFKVKAFHSSPPLHHDSHLWNVLLEVILAGFLPERTTHCGCITCDERERGAYKLSHVSSPTFHSFLSSNEFSERQQDSYNSGSANFVQFKLNSQNRYFWFHLSHLVSTLCELS